MNNDCDNIHGTNSEDVVIERVRVEGGSTGIELGSCARAQLREIVSRNVRGPYPRGQCVQFSHSSHGTLEDFSCVNDDSAWTEDSISVWRSANVTLRDGLVDGNNSPTGAADAARALF